MLCANHGIKSVVVGFVCLEEVDVRKISVIFPFVNNDVDVYDDDAVLLVVAIPCIHEEMKLNECKYMVIETVCFSTNKSK